MKITLNNKTFDSKEYKGSTVELLEEITYNFLNDKRFEMMEKVGVVYEILVNYTKEITENHFKPLFEYYKLTDDRDKLELTIEQYKMTKYLISGDKRPYTKYLEELEQYEAFSKDKALMSLLDYKMARFSDMIFKEMGIEIIDKIDGVGYIVRDNGLYKN